MMAANWLYQFPPERPHSYCKSQRLTQDTNRNSCHKKTELAAFSLHRCRNKFGGVAVRLLYLLREERLRLLLGDPACPGDGKIGNMWEIKLIHCGLERGVNAKLEFE